MNLQQTKSNFGQFDVFEVVETFRQFRAIQNNEIQWNETKMKDAFPRRRQRVCVVVPAPAFFEVRVSVPSEKDFFLKKINGLILYAPHMYPE